MEIWSKCDICGRDIPVGELCYGLKKGNCICKNCCTGFENCTFTLAPMPTLTPPNEWVSVEDALPRKITNKVLVFCENGYIGYGHYEEYQGEKTWYNLESGEPFSAWDIGGCAPYKVTHWMPLPSPPEEVREDK